MSTATCTRPVRRDKKAELADPERLKSGNYRVYVWDPDLRKKKWVPNPDTGNNSFADDTAARQAQRAFKRQMDAGYKAAGSPLVRQLHIHEFEAVAKAWLATQGGTEQTRRTLRSAVAMLCEKFGRTDVRTITKDDVMTYLADEQQAWSSSTVESRLVYLRQIMQYAMEAPRHYREDDPTKGLKVDVQRKNAVRYLKDQEFLFLINFMPVWFFPAAFLAYDCGLRAGEVAGLRWKRLDLDGPIPSVLVKEVMDPDRTLRHFPKGKDEGRVTLPKRVVVALKALRRWRGTDTDDDFVFRNSRNRPMAPWDSSRYMKEAWEKSGLTGDRAVFHHLRHACANNLALAGAPVRVIMERMRHKSLKVTQQYLDDVALDVQADWANRVDEMHAAALEEKAIARAREKLGTLKPPHATEDRITLTADQWAAVQLLLDRLQPVGG